MLLRPPDLDDVRRVLANALCTTYRSDRWLFKEESHERAIMFHVGRHVADSVESWSGGWAVDLEYNRSHDVSLPSKGRDPKVVYGKRRLPDLIIHRRGESGSDHNLLAVEAKLVENKWTKDFRTLEGLVSELGYQSRGISAAT
jgi:hypothetical protein